MIHTLIDHIMHTLNEQKNTTHSFSSTQIEIPNEIAEKILAFSLAIPDDKIYEDPNDPSYGRELEPHVTIKYGLDTEIPEDVKEVTPEEVDKIRVILKNISLFQPQEKPYDVLKVDVDSLELYNLNGIFSKLPSTNTHPTYIPHLTIAYLKKGMGSEYVNRGDFNGVSFEVDSFTFKGRNGSSEVIKLPVISLEPEIEEPVVVEDETGEVIKGQEGLPNFTPQI